MRNLSKETAESNAGFTLLEMLSVLVIVIVIMSITVAAFIGAFRTTSVRAALTNIDVALAQARQQSLSLRTHTYLFFAPGGMSNMYYACAQQGIHVGSNSSHELQLSVPIHEDLTGGEVCNLTLGTRDFIITNGVHTNHVHFLRTSNRWDTGNRYGWPATDKRLPNGIVFGTNTEDVVFKPNGTTRKVGTGNYIITLQELNTNNTVATEITVHGLTGYAEITSDGS
jgi:Tfp pilus assembly protein FimT